jgi:hypothetical protein
VNLAGEEIVREPGINPAAGIDSNQRAELLRRWHSEDAERDKENEEKQ